MRRSVARRPDVEQKIQGAEGRLPWPRAAMRNYLLAVNAAGRNWSGNAALSLQAVERLTSVLVLPHPEREAARGASPQSNPETEAAAMQAVMDARAGAGPPGIRRLTRRIWATTSPALDLRIGRASPHRGEGAGCATGTILLTPNERRVAEDRRDCYWLYVVTDCDDMPRLQEPIRDPARLDWNEVTKVAHYYLA